MLDVSAFIEARRGTHILESIFNVGAASFQKMNLQQPTSNPVTVVQFGTCHSVPTTYAACFLSTAKQAGPVPVRTYHFTSSEAQSGQQYHVLRPDSTSIMGGRQ